MSWNYRMVKRRKIKGQREEYYAVHEVYYDKLGAPWSMTADAVGFGGETPNEVIAALTLALRDVQNSPVLIEPKKWPGKAP